MADQETVTVERRRKTEQSGQRQRAEASQRQRTDGGGSAPPPSGGSGGGGYPPSGGSGGGGYSSGPRRVGPGGGMPIPGGGCGLAIVAILMLGFALFGLFGGGDNNTPIDTANQDFNAPSGEVAGDFGSADSNPGLGQAGGQVVATLQAPGELAPTATPRPAAAAAAPSTSGQTWTVLLYQDADDQVLEKDIIVDLNEAERIGSTDRVNIVSQLDRYRGGYTGDGDWTETRRYFIRQDQDLNTLNSDLLQRGEVNMSDGNSLVDFVQWGIENYPADKYVLILSDHGMGWPGGWSDPDPGGAGPREIPLARVMGDELYLMELDDALSQIQRTTGLDKFEIIGMDACLMSHLEVYNALEPYARYAVASQETEPALGWAYTGFLDTLTRNPDMSGADLSRSIVDTYIRSDQRILDDRARAEMYSRGSFISALSAPSAEAVAQQMSQDITLTAIDLSQVPALNAALDSFVSAAQQVDPRSMAKARQYAQSYTSIWGSDVPPSYIDLGHFVGLVRQVDRSGQLSQAADGVTAAIQSAVIAEKHGPNKPGSTGVSIYFPTSQLYGTREAGPQSYVAVSRRFAENTLWDEFLAFFFTGQTFEPAARGAAIPAGITRAPGTTPIEISPIQATSTDTAPGRPITLTAEISGQDIGYVYLFTGYYDAQGNSINVIDMDYLESPDTQELNGVFYPVWPEDGSFRLQFVFEPLAFALSDGETTAEALLNPETYGADASQATYTVEGMYNFANGDPPRHARAYLRDGLLRQVFAFNEADGQGAPWEVTMQPGDTFTVLQKWLDLGDDGRVVNTAFQEGETIAVGDAPIRWEELDAAAGDYVVGFIVEDLDGNQTPVYQKITVN